ncbi:hypothetical protein K438DRAFT_560952 [Mycena galopus ATCC 62051]|nr:hypothetical protein K438DRAFT_560952 [Mycena galopus ATCC 62051]
MVAARPRPFGRGLAPGRRRHGHDMGGAGSAARRRRVRKARFLQLLEYHLTACLRRCPSLREINYYLFTTVPPEMDLEEAVYPSVESISIHMAEIPFLEDVQDEWEHMRRHFEAFSSGMFPNLRYLPIFGMPARVLKDERFSSMHKRLSDRRCVLEFPDKSL